MSFNRTEDSKIDDGGMAFPGIRYQQVGLVSDYGYSDDDSPRFADVQHPGMSLRDWFAGNEKVPEELSIDYAEALVGRDHPHKKTALGKINPEATIETIIFWSEAQARYRYIMADAMIAARKAGK